MKKIFAIIAFALLGLTACDLLDKEPLSDLSPESYFTTETELKLFSNTFYNSILDKTPYRSQSDQYIEYDPSDFIKGGNSRTVPASGGG
ncbi:MAG: RagB/SusD family nutrient uptake outer membrane protein, partial [Bacteroidales bacterium]|nr:RagB/SusD family nutrient uptake outer membrane protein [Bacteroidales bacterium]